MRGSAENPLISVIIPVYNTKEYLRRCVESVCAQTYSQLEILLVDDGSTDGSERLCDELAAEDSRIVVYHKENGGSSSARNVGLKIATGEYLGFVDSDDYISPEMYALLLAAIRQNEVTVAQIGRDEIDEEGNRLPDICVPPKKAELITNKDFLKELLMHRGDCSFCTKLFAREVLAGKEFPVGALNEDFHFLVELLQEIRAIISLPEQTYHVFYRMNSNSRKKDPEQFSRVFVDNINNADMVLKYVDKQDADLQEIAFRFGMFQRMDYMLHVPISQMNRKNPFYRQVVSYIRKNWGHAMRTPYLTGKNKVYLSLFALAPKGVRQLHYQLKLKHEKGTS